MGTGEIVLLSKIGGREKLDLLAGMRLHQRQCNHNPNLDARSSLAHRGLYCNCVQGDRDPVQAGAMRQDRRVSAKWYFTPVSQGL